MCICPRSQEEETARLQAAKRRLQREVDELTDQNEQLQRDVARKGYASHECIFSSKNIGFTIWASISAPLFYVSMCLSCSPSADPAPPQVLVVRVMVLVVFVLQDVASSLAASRQTAGTRSQMTTRTEH